MTNIHVKGWGDHTLWEMNRSRYIELGNVLALTLNINPRTNRSFKVLSHPEGFEVPWVGIDPHSEYEEQTLWEMFGSSNVVDDLGFIHYELFWPTEGVASSYEESPDNENTPWFSFAHHAKNVHVLGCTRVFEEIILGCISYGYENCSTNQRKYCYLVLD